MVPIPFSLRHLLRSLAFVSLALPQFLSAAAPRLEGCVRSPLALEAPALAACARHVRLARWADQGGRYRASVEVSGVSLRDLLERAIVAKTEPDGFNRELDLMVVAEGKGGERAILSWGEIFLSEDRASFLVADRVRPLVPQHHSDLSGTGWDPAVFLDSGAREKADLSACASCHDGSSLLRLELPRGLCLVAARDRSARRFIPELLRLEVRQAGLSAKASRGKEDSLWVDCPDLVLPSGRRVPLSPARLTGLVHATWQGDAIGLGRGFQGTRSWEGVSLRDLLRRHLPVGCDPSAVAVLVSAPDGYRSLFSGSEIFDSRMSKPLVLADRQDGRPLSRKDGRYRLAACGDFFVDRAVRSVAEIRILLPLGAPAPSTGSPKPRSKR